MPVGPAHFYATNHLTIDYDTADIRVVLLADTYTPNQGSHSTWSDASAHEISTGGGYTQNGESVTVTRTVTLDTSPDPDVYNVDIEFANVEFTGFTGTYKYVGYVVNSSGTLAGTDKLVAYFDAETGGGSVTGNGQSHFVGSDGAYMLRSALST